MVLTPNNQSSRPQRHKVLSKRAEESHSTGEAIPGLSSHALSTNSPGNPSGADSTHTISSPSVNLQSQTQGEKFASAMAPSSNKAGGGGTNPTKNALSTGRSGAIPKGNRPKAAPRAIASPSTPGYAVDATQVALDFMKSRDWSSQGLEGPARIGHRPAAQSSSMATSGSPSPVNPFNIRPFPPDVLMIYNWERPRPKDFTNLSEGQRAWKAKQDIEHHKIDWSDGGDEWTSFVAMEEDAGRQMHFSIAHNFVSRAKRVFWAGRSWIDFEQEELAIDTMAEVKAEPDPVRREMAALDRLDNDLRLAVFETLKYRLCNEIWLEAYPEPRPAEGKRKKDSAIDDAVVEQAAKRHAAGSKRATGGAGSQRLTLPEEPVDHILDEAGKLCIRPGQPQSAGVLGMLSQEEREQIRAHPEWANQQPVWKGREELDFETSDEGES